MTKTYYFTGQAYWTKLDKPDEKYKYWGLYLRLDDENRKVLKESGLQLTPGKDKKEGWEYIRLRRPMQKPIKGELVDFEKPKLVDSDNIEYIDRPLVGNGSYVTCKVLVYDTMKGPGHRLEAVRVDSLVEYVPVENKDEAPF